MGVSMEFIGASYNRWTLRKFVSRNARGDQRWDAECSCGRTKEVILRNVVRGLSKSCGCHRKEAVAAARTAHGQAARGRVTSEYGIWRAMLARCRNQNVRAYKNYGARGITVCERWDSFENFYEDMGPRPPRMTLDRRDNSLGYCKENCRWITRREQARNTRANRIVEYRGESRCVAEWSEITGIPAGTLIDRLGYDGWSIEDAFNRPIKGR